MHEDAVATVREEEGHGLILTVGLWSLRVGHTQVNLLPHLVQRCERLAAAIDPFAWCQGKHGVDAPRIVRASLDKREGQQLYLTRIVIDVMTCLCQNTPLRILHHNPEGILLNLNRSVGRFCGRIRLSRFKSITEHHIILILILRFDGRCEHTDTNRPLTHPLHLDLQLRIVLIRRIGEVEHLHSYWPIAVQVECLTRTQSIALPLH